MAELLDKDHDNLDDDEDLDLDRYDSAAGWDGSDADEPHTKTDTTPASPTHKTPYAQQLPYLPHESMFEIRSANAAMRTEPPVDLIPGLWRTGELALLIGEPGIGKSLLAVQFAESIARGVGVLAALPTHAAQSGVPSLVTRHSSLVPKEQPVLLLDLDQTDAQFAERYTCPSPFPGRRPVKYRFSPKLIRPSYRDFGHIPEEFNDSLTKYFDASIEQAIGEADAKVIIIDNLAALSPYARNNSAHIRMLNALKLTATTRNLSILVIHTAKPQKRRSQKSAARNSASSLHPSSFIPHPFESAADSVFAICPTTFGPEYRYIKMLKSKNSPVGVSAALPTHAATGVDPDVLVFQLDRTAGPHVSSPRVSKGVISATESTETALVPMIPQSAIRTPHSAGPFLGFEYLGVSPEIDLTRDYEAEAIEAERLRERERKRLWKRGSKEFLIEGILDGSYGRYLKGE